MLKHCWGDKAKTNEMAQTCDENGTVHPIEHVMRMASSRIPQVALHWTLHGKRKRGRPRTTCRTSTSELEEMGLSMSLHGVYL